MASANADEVFEADANAEVRAEARAHTQSRPSRPESRDKKPLLGSVDHAVYEETPLLERDFDGRQHGSDGPPERDAPEWSGARDFEGRPWYRKPSVSADSRTLHDL